MSSYSSDKVKNFNDNLNEFQTQILSYQDKLNDFQTKIDFIFKNQQNMNNTEQIVKDGSDTYYLCTKEGYMFEIDNSYNGMPSGSYPTINKPTPNEIITINGKSYYYSNNKKAASINENNTNKYFTNSIMQTGFQDFETSSNMIDSSVNYLINGNTFDQSFVALSGSVCNIDSFHQCANFARTNHKAENDQYNNFGLGMDNNSCVCFTATNDNVNNRTGEYTISSTDCKKNDNNDIVGSYFGMMYDGNFYTLKDIVYRKNFDGFYMDNGSHTLIHTDNVSENSGCNKFSGAGPTNINIYSFDSNDVCKLKQSTASESE